MNFVEKTKMIILEPSRFFDKIKREKNIGEVIRYYFFVSLISSTILSLLYAFLINPSNIEISIYLLSILFLPLVSVIFSLVVSSIIHIFALILRGKGNFLSTYKSIAYGEVPFLLLGWIPFLGLVFLLYSLYVTVIGITKLHRVSALRAIFILLLPIFIIILLIISFFLLSTIHL